MRLRYAIISGENPPLPARELEAILEAEAGPWGYRLHGWLDGLAVFEAELRWGAWQVTYRAGYTREVGLLLAADSLPRARSAGRRAGEELRRLGLRGPFRIEAVVHGPYAHARGKTWLTRMVARGLADAGVEASPRGRQELRAFATEGVVVIGLPEARLDTRSLMERSPGRRPFFKPGPLSPQLSRAFVNLARLRRGDVYLDPFCGTGGFAIEACLMGASRCLCGDLDWAMISGAPRNLRAYCRGHGWLVAAWNAASLPVAPGSVDAIATDPPYGRSTTTGGQGYVRLVRGFLEEAARSVKHGGYIVYAGPVKYKPWVLAEEAGLRVVDRIEMYVHGSLTRAIVVARR